MVSDRVLRDAATKVAPEMSSGEIREAIIGEEPAGKVRPDKFLAELFPDVNRSRIQRAIEYGEILVNGVPVTRKQRFKSGDQVMLMLPALTGDAPKAVAIPLDIVFEDEEIIVVNKAPGMVTHPGNGTGDDTLVHALLAHCEGKLSRINGEDRPGIVHRLDKDTSGLIVAAKTDTACSRLIAAFKGRDLTKEYLALACGCPDTQSGTIETGIARHATHRTRMSVVDDGKAAHTDWEVIASRAPVTLFRCHIHTGRTHQIRVHLSHLGHPIIGDRLYGFHPSRLSTLKLKASRPLLHAWRLAFSHPVTGEALQFEIPPPPDFNPWVEWIYEGESAIPPIFA